MVESHRSWGSADIRPRPTVVKRSKVCSGKGLDSRAMQSPDSVESLPPSDSEAAAQAAGTSGTTEAARAFSDPDLPHSQPTWPHPAARHHALLLRAVAERLCQEPACQIFGVALEPLTQVKAASLMHRRTLTAPQPPARCCYLHRYGNLWFLAMCIATGCAASCRLVYCLEPLLT